jgi:hypothetical protein
MHDTIIHSQPQPLQPHCNCALLTLITWLAYPLHVCVLAVHADAQHLCVHGCKLIVPVRVGGQLSGACRTAEIGIVRVAHIRTQVQILQLLLLVLRHHRSGAPNRTYCAAQRINSCRRSIRAASILHCFRRIRKFVPTCRKVP